MNEKNKLTIEKIIALSQRILADAILEKYGVAQGDFINYKNNVTLLLLEISEYE